MKRRVRLYVRLILLAAALTFLFPKASLSLATEPAAEEQYNQILLKHPRPRLHWATWRMIQAQQKGALSQLAAKLLITVDKGMTKSVAIEQSTGFETADADLVHWIETKWRFRPEITRRFTLPVYVINDSIFSSPHVTVTKALTPPQSDIVHGKSIKNRKLLLDIELDHGKIIDVRVFQSSGNPKLDAATVQWVTTSWTFPKSRTGLYHLPFTFNQKE